MTVIFVTGADRRASAAEWPGERQFLVVEPPMSLDGTAGSAAVAEGVDGSLLALLYWPVIREDESGSAEWPRTRLVRVTPAGSSSFVRPFGDLVPGSRDLRMNADDEILPLPDGSLLFSRDGAIDLRRVDGSVARFAGTGRAGFSGDGGPATAAEIGFVRGLTRLADGSVLFGDESRVRRVAADGTISTVAGSGEFGFSGDGGPATAARFGRAQDVVAAPGGGFLIADYFNGRVRRVGPDGIISTVASGFALPTHVAVMPDGMLLVAETLAIAERARIRQVAADGATRTVFRLPEGRAGRPGDFAGRWASTIEAIDVTREGGIIVMVAGAKLRTYYLAPPRTRRVLVNLRDAHTSPRRVKATVDVTVRGRLRLQVLRRGRTVAASTTSVDAGRRTVTAAGRFRAGFHDVRVTLRAAGGGSFSDAIRLFTGQALPERLVLAPLGEGVERCRRLDARRIDCAHHYQEGEEDGRPCLLTNAYRLVSSGVLFRRPYHRDCHRRPMPFDRTPKWTGPWLAWPP